MNLNLSLLSWVAYLIIGRILIYLWQQFPLPKFLEEKKTIKYLHECDLCSGVYVLTGLAVVMKMDILSVMGFMHVPLVGEIVTGAVMSFFAHILLIGWHSKFDAIQLE